MPLQENCLLVSKDCHFGEWSNNNIVGVKPTKYFLDVFFQYQEQFFKSKTNLCIRSKHLIELKPLYSIHWTRSDALGDKVILHLKCGNHQRHGELLVCWRYVLLDELSIVEHTIQLTWSEKMHQPFNQFFHYVTECLQMEKRITTAKLLRRDYCLQWT